MTVATDYDALLLDLDGTIYQGGAAIPGAVSAVGGSGLPAVYVTNNASRAPRDVAEQLNDLGLETTPDQVMTSALAAIQLAQERVPSGSTVLVLGTDSFRELALDAGFTVTDTADDRPAAVLHGHNPETGWRQLSEAALAIREGALYLASNLDTTLPKERGLHVGNGSMVAAVVSATGVTPISAGKPEPAMFHSAAGTLGCRAPLAVGDRLDTDIAGGVAAGMDTLCVLTGVSGHHDVLRAPQAQRPTLISDTLDVFDRETDTLRPGPRGGFTATLDGGILRIDGGTPDSTPVQALLTAVDVAWTSGVRVDEVDGVSADARRVLGQWW
ncbi:HAD-IIA family hydrolase [Corynebacterium pygosceleis]|uniref:HAD-IIA family hydrolase n=1 Tax=Corynebacterium pygosceleis TaxID=2800406 RepID=UPI001903C3DD|nr:HAD-IIA family hydrolase [Corynebacterium pygosceleis]MCK7674613.1 HAD-IIA family hydrolase [Corynebacterium pygosceleis]MCL0120085.1 HAD-IIA family hydrolase [Corynebacterium pygosceleis]